MLLFFFKKTKWNGLFGKNYTRRFKQTDLFEQIFERIIEECFRSNLVDLTVIFVDATHIKANANKKKSAKVLSQVHALHYEDQLLKEINEDRHTHGKKPFSDKDDLKLARMKKKYGLLKGSSGSLIQILVDRINSYF